MCSRCRVCLNCIMTSASLRRFVDWEERFVSHDRGSRVVHYYLRDRSGHQCLAVVGTERSLRHMVYVVCDEFLPLAGLDKSTTSAFKWRARREVVDWLSSLLTKTRSSDAHHSAGSPRNGINSSTDVDSAQSFEADGLESGQEDSDVRRQCSGSNADVTWVGSAWICRKRLRHFNSFQRNGITIAVQDFVYVMTEEKDRHIAYVEDLFEDKKLRKKLRVRWFHKTSELLCKIPPPAPLAREVFYTTFQQDLSVECVDGVATVLTPEHYELCLAMLPVDTASQVHMCSRQFDSEGIRSFNLQEVKGYWQQSVLLLTGLSSSRSESVHDDQGSEDLEMDEEDGAEQGKVIRRGPRTARSSRWRGGGASRASGASNGDLLMSTLRINGDLAATGSGQSGGKLPSSFSGRNEDGCLESGLCLYEVGDQIETLCEDSGLRGCWFKGTVMAVGLRRVRVRYDNLFDEEGGGNLEEWVPSCKVAGLCQLGIRAPGRMTIRPILPDFPRVDFRLVEGEVVDAWMHDGWWEGVIKGEESSSGEVSVYFPGEHDTSSIKVSDLRPSKEWIKGVWTSVPIFRFSLLSLSSEEREEKVRESIVCWNTLLEKKRSVSARELAREQNTSITSNMCSGSILRMIAKRVSGGATLDELFGGRSVQQDTCRTSMAAMVHPVKVEAIVLPVKQECHEDGSSPESSQRLECDNVNKRAPASSLKWKVGKKRQRQGDLATSRMERCTAHSANEVKESSVDSGREVSSDRIKGELLQEDSEQELRWKNGNAEETVMLKKLIQGNDTSLKSMHGAATPMGRSLFIDTMPLANLVMSR